MTLLRCHVCQSTNLAEHARYGDLRRVTSDCKPWPGGSPLYSCRQCGCTQVNCDARWTEEVGIIYKNYSIYYQGEGEEQRVFDAVTGQTLPRSEWLLERIISQVRLSEKGRALDIGCGNGRFLKAFGKSLPSWRLTGTEFDEQHKNLVENLPRVEKLHTGPLSGLAGEYDFISLIHVLEHIPNPVAFLREVATKLAPEGILFVELPSYQTNPFELLIADHATHFTLPSITQVLALAGFAAEQASMDWVPKEISILARKANEATPPLGASFQQVDEALDWLHQLLTQARELAGSAPRFGIFGTSIAGTWLASNLSRRPDLFVDEDRNRIGKTHFNAPIYAPQEVPSGSVVFIAQPEAVARKIAQRLSRPGVDYLYPEPERAQVR
jgi:2-polyprenyl-3-methyl-5-hydroxy-6-metoxy-1,4-benzoquinol methylase